MLHRNNVDNLQSDGTKFGYGSLIPVHPIVKVSVASYHNQWFSIEDDNNNENEGTFWNFADTKTKAKIRQEIGMKEKSMYFSCDENM